ncbi:mediator of RNA polymerase II transcription subunit 11-like [Styela clava]|uniref:mediator of RNA polymerase II transcription subunit 11-like n=1 Tax=Styela clava TaxID=7725 RepID=UPI00193A99A1|nr:mediator of RNA polymerase II transcription subunit 11-like [Styela clava]XP_039254885.1 mediator of RNA polymerase II transcription subunit 11-like isoform X3 [Styela clava]
MNSENVPDRLKALEEIEKKITSALNNAALALQELGKDRPMEKNVEKHSASYMKALEEVETDMLMQINYLTQVATGQQHEGSCYTAQKRVQMLKETITEIENQVGNMTLSPGSSNRHNGQ